MELLINLTVNGLATGMLIFLLASGLTLIFGLMSVLILHMADCLPGEHFQAVWFYGLSGSFLSEF